MSYYFRDSGYPGEDYLIVTKKGKEEGNLPDGIILLGGLMYCSIAFRNWITAAGRTFQYWLALATNTSMDLYRSNLVLLEQKS